MQKCGGEGICSLTDGSAAAAVAEHVLSGSFGWQGHNIGLTCPVPELAS